MWLIVFLACANNIQALYDAEKTQVMAAPPPIGNSWEPEMRLRFSDQALQALAETAVDGGLLKAEDKITFKGPLGVEAELAPDVAVKGIKIGASTSCEACLDLGIDLDGKGKWKVSSLKGEVPISLNVKAVLGFDVKKEGETYTVTGRLKDVGSVKVKTELAGDVDLAKPLQGWTESLAKKIPPMEITSFGGEDLPLRAFRLTTTSGALTMEAVSDVAGGGPVKVPAKPLSQGWEMSISTATALAMMRRAAFEAGVIDYDVAADPRALELQGTVFTMGVRLWRLTRSGWWRDYNITGQIEVAERGIKLVPKVAKEGEKSQGAGIADPLALLAEGAILDAVSDGLAQTLPSSESTTLGDKSVTARVTTVRGMASSLIVSGDLEIGVKSESRSRSGKSERERHAGRRPAGSSAGE